jgi:hypothetical protein
MRYVPQMNAAGRQLRRLTTSRKDFKLMYYMPSYLAYCSITNGGVVNLPSVGEEPADDGLLREVLYTADRWICCTLFKAVLG